MDELLNIYKNPETALLDARRIWEYLRDNPASEMGKSWFVAKADAVRALNLNLAIEHMCPLCEHLKQLGKSASPLSVHIENCEKFCPVKNWSEVKNRDTVPCESYDSPYNIWMNAVADCDEEQERRAADEMVKLMEDALTGIRKDKEK